MWLFRSRAETVAVPQPSRDCGSSAAEQRLWQFRSRAGTVAVPQPNRDCGCSAAEQRLWLFRSRTETVSVPNLGKPISGTLPQLFGVTGQEKKLLKLHITKHTTGAIYHRCDRPLTHSYALRTPHTLVHTLDLYTPKLPTSVLLYA